MSRLPQKHEEVERSLRTTYRKRIWNPFIAGIRQYEMIKENDKIAVCISGGKDSMLLAKLMQELHRHSEVPFELVFLVMDPGYSDINRQLITDNAALLGIPVTVFDSDIFRIAANTEKSPCYLCARMRRGHLYEHAQALGCNKIALGHHFSDVVETTLMGLLYGSQFQAMMPKLHSTNFPGMELIRPMYRVHEESIIAWKNHNHLTFIQCACRFTEKSSAPDSSGESKRKEIKLLLKELKKVNPNVEKNIFNSIQSVNLNTVIGYRKDGTEHSFLEDYDRPVK